MKHKPFAIWIVAVSVTCGWSRLADAEEAASPLHVAYRLVEPKTLHFDDPQKHAAHADQVRKLGCEISEAAHAEHGDLIYHCPKWRALKVADDTLAHQWEEWLLASGFETLHGHPEAETAEHEESHAPEPGHEEHEHEEVLYSLSDWITLNPAQEADYQELVAIVSALGCEVRETRNEGHAEISIRCPERMHIEVESHAAAEFWHDWLTKTGFEAQHED